MIKNMNNTYLNQRVKLDGNSFQNCVFDNCTLEYSGTSPLSMDGCSFNNSQWVFSGPAQNTLQFLAGLYHGMGDGGRKVVEATFDNIKNKA